MENGDAASVWNNLKTKMIIWWVFINWASISLCVFEMCALSLCHYSTDCKKKVVSYLFFFTFFAPSRFSVAVSSVALCCPAKMKLQMENHPLNEIRLVFSWRFVYKKNERLLSLLLSFAHTQNVYLERWIRIRTVSSDSPSSPNEGWAAHFGVNGSSFSLAFVKTICFSLQSSFRKHFHHTKP